MVLQELQQQELCLWQSGWRGQFPISETLGELASMGSDALFSCCWPSIYTEISTYSIIKPHNILGGEWAHNERERTRTPFLQPLSSRSCVSHHVASAHASRPTGSRRGRPFESQQEETHRAASTNRCGIRGVVSNVVFTCIYMGFRQRCQHRLRSNILERGCSTLALQSPQELLHSP